MHVGYPPNKLLVHDVIDHSFLTYDCTNIDKGEHENSPGSADTGNHRA